MSVIDAGVVEKKRADVRAFKETFEVWAYLEGWHWKSWHSDLGTANKTCLYYLEQGFRETRIVRIPGDGEPNEAERLRKALMDVAGYIDEVATSDERMVKLKQQCTEIASYARRHAEGAKE